MLLYCLIIFISFYSKANNKYENVEVDECRKISMDKLKNEWFHGHLEVLIGDKIK